MYIYICIYIYVINIYTIIIIIYLFLCIYYIVTWIHAVVFLSNVRQWKTTTSSSTRTATKQHLHHHQQQQHQHQQQQQQQQQSNISFDASPPLVDFPAPRTVPRTVPRCPEQCQVVWSEVKSKAPTEEEAPRCLVLAAEDSEVRRAGSFWGGNHWKGRTTLENWI